MRDIDIIWARDAWYAGDSGRLLACIDVSPERVCFVGDVSPYRDWARGDGARVVARRRGGVWMIANMRATELDSGLCSAIRAIESAD